MITVKNLCYSYAKETLKSQEMTIKNVSFSIDEGEWIAIVGRNGSGKSTLAKLLDGLLMADSGDIVVGGMALTPETVWDIRSQIGVVFQNPDNQFVGATVQDDVAFGLENQGVQRLDMIERVEEALRLVDMWAFKDKEPSKLSGGQKQRVAIASVLALRPKIIILDEATAMLDPKGRKQVIDVIKSLKKRLNLTVISITHDVEEAMLSDRLLVMNRGVLMYQDTPDVIFEKHEEMKAFGLDIPFSETVRRGLAKKGINVPEHFMTDRQLEEWVCQSLLNK